MLQVRVINNETDDVSLHDALYFATPKPRLVAPDRVVQALSSLQVGSCGEVGQSGINVVR